MALAAAVATAQALGYNAQALTEALALAQTAKGGASFGDCCICMQLMKFSS